MPPKNRKLTFLDLPVPGAKAPAALNATDDVVAAPSFRPGAPQNVVLISDVIYASAAPQSYIEATWEPPESTTAQRPEQYTIQVSTSTAFTASGTITTTFAPEDPEAPSMRVDGLPPNTLHYVRLRAIVRGYPGDWTSMSPLTTGVNRITTAQDTTAATQPASLTGSWIGTGDLLLTWTNSTSANFKEVEIKIYASNGGTLLRTINSAAGRFLYTAAMNVQDTSGVGDPSLYVEARSRTFSNVLNNTSPPTLTTTKPRPSVPTVAHSWSAETDHAGVAGADLTFTLVVSSDTVKCTLSLNSQAARDIYGTVYTYSYTRNVADNGGAGDPTIGYSITAVDGLGQTSATAASGTATNEDPPTTAISITAGFSSLAVGATPSAAADLKDYTFRIIKDGGTLTSYRSASPDQLYKATARGSYQVGVTVNDVFGLSSVETVSSAIVLDAVTNTEIREDAIYTDSIGTDFTIAPNKTVLKDDITGAGITYAASASAWRYTQLERPLTQRGRRISTKLGSGAANFYIGTSLDGTTWSWYAGVGGDGYTLTARADEATAQANASLFSAATNGWVESPSTVEFRYVRLGHRHTSASYRLDEFYMYTLIIADMIRAGDIKTIHLAAGSVTADKISVLQLSAITADMGNLTAGTITGATIRSAASGARWEGNTTHLFGTDGTTTQWEVLNSSGKLTAAAGNLILDSDGATIIASTGIVAALRWKGAADSGNIANLWALRSSSGAQFDDFRIERRRRDATNLSQIIIAEDLISLYPDAAAGGLEVGDTVITAYTGITATGISSFIIEDTNTAAQVTPLILTHNVSSGTPEAGMGVRQQFRLESTTTADTDVALIRAEWVVATHASRTARVTHFVFDTAARETFREQVSGSAAMLGFFGAAAVTRPTVTGSRGGNAALQSLCTALANLGLITDSSSA